MPLRIDLEPGVARMITPTARVWKEVMAWIQILGIYPGPWNYGERPDRSTWVMPLRSIHPHRRQAS